VIVGSGFGGSATAYALTQGGMDVLLVERGDWVERDALDWDPVEVLVKQRYAGPQAMLVNQYRDTAYAPVYSSDVVGGMSVFYGGASMRLRETDFAEWPIGYDDLEAYYGRAEALLEIHGRSGDDPFEPPRSTPYAYPPAALTPPAARVYDACVRLGLQPSTIPLAINFENPERTLCEKCVTCDGFPCRIGAKNDLATTMLAQAASQGMSLRPGVAVTRLTERGGRVRSVSCADMSTGERFEVSGNVVILCAGAIGSPAILLRSELEHYPHTRYVGRYLMRHCNAVLTYVCPFRTNPESVFHKQVCITDFYEDQREDTGRSVGVIQDIYSPAPEVLKHFAPRGLKHAAAWMAKYMRNLLCIAEDEPSFDNAVTLSADLDALDVRMPRVYHRYSAEDYARRDYLIDRAKQVLREAGGWIPNLYEIDTFSHAVGTVRFGDEADDSALDPDCRFWGVDNLYVVDGSFMPTPGGVNPSLTIAANALRVADRVLARPHPG